MKQFTVIEQTLSPVLNSNSQGAVKSHIHLSPQSEAYRTYYEFHKFWKQRTKTAWKTQKTKVLMTGSVRNRPVPYIK